MAKKIDINNLRQDGWINYDFPSSEKFDFSQNTEFHLAKIKNTNERSEFTEQIFQNFIEYFENNQQEYLDYLNNTNIDFK